MSANAKPRATLAVGWFDNAPFQVICASRLARIKEVFFAWPGVKASRPMDPWTPERRAGLIADLRWARANGLALDAIFNASCYGDIALTETLADHVTAMLREMDAEGVFPEHVTTTSPFIATVLRQRFPQVKIRFSVNMEIASTLALEYVDELYDSFYADRNLHRRLDYVAELHQWAQARGKQMGLYVNSGCLRNCPFHHFHNNLHGHNRMGQSAAGEKFNFSVFRCRTNYERGHWEDFLRALWLRPEELPRYEAHADVIKLATRRHPDPGAVIRAYADYSYAGDLTKIVDPFFDFPASIDNQALGASALWPQVRDCPNASNCRHCGKCTELLREVSGGKMAETNHLTGSFVNFFKG